MLVQGKKQIKKMIFLHIDPEVAFGSRFLQMPLVQKTQCDTVQSQGSMPVSDGFIIQSQSKTLESIGCEEIGFLYALMLILLEGETGINRSDMHPVLYNVEAGLSAHTCCQHEGPLQPTLTSTDKETLTLTKNCRRYCMLQRKCSYSHTAEVFPISLGHLMRF